MELKNYVCMLSEAHTRGTALQLLATLMEQSMLAHLRIDTESWYQITDASNHV